MTPGEQSGIVRTCQNGHDWLDDGATQPPVCPKCGQQPQSAYDTHVLDGAAAASAGATGAISEIPGYEVIDELGRGAMGVVYQARQVALNRLVALKLLRLESNAPVHLARFCREGEVLASLQHPNIIPIYDIGEADGRPFMAMELVAGGNLGDVLDATPLPPAVAARVTLLLARTIHAAHLRDIIHRDLKPANVLIGVLGPSIWQGRDERRAAFIDCFAQERSDDRFQLKIADFGLAYTARLQRKDDARVVGTPAYMAPEQADGKPAGAEADVYSLGVMLYEMLTGRPPFLAESGLLTLMQVMLNDPVPPAQLQPGVPADLENICLMCLQKGPLRRYRTAQKLAEDLQRFLDGEPVRARPIGGRERLLKWARRQPYQAALAGFALATVIGVFGMLLFFNLRLHSERNRARSNEILAGEQAELARARERDAQRQAERARRSLYALQLVQTAALVENAPLRALEQLADTGPCPFDLRDLAWNYLVASAQQQGPLTQDLELPARQVRCSKDGSFLAVLAAGEEGKGARILILDAASRATRATLRSPQPAIADLALSPDGNLLAAAGLDGTVIVFDRSKGTVRNTFNAHRPSARSVSFAPDGKTLASGGDDRYLRIWDLDSGSERAALLGHAASIRAVAFSPDGSLVASASSDGTIKLWDVAASRAYAALDGHRGEVVALAFAPDGQLLASSDFLHNQGEMRLWQVKPARAAAVVPRRDAAVLALEFTRDGRTLVAADTLGTLRLCDALTGQERATLRGGKTPIQGIALSPSGTELSAATGQTLRTWSVPQPPLAGLLHGHAGPVTSVAFAPDGRLLASAGADSAVKLWSIASGQLQATLVGHADWVHAVVFCGAGTLASGDERGQLHLWDIVAGKELGRFPVHEQAIRALACSPDGLWLASGSKDGSVKLRHVEDGTERTLLERGGGEVRTLAFAPDGRVLAAGLARPDGAGSVKLIELHDNDKVRTLDGPASAITALAYSPDGTLLATAERTFVVQVWELPAGKRLYEAPRSGTPVFTRDGKHLIVSGFNHSTRWLDARSGVPQGGLLTQHRDVVAACAVSPAGRLLATASWDQTIWLRGLPDQ